MAGSSPEPRQPPVPRTSCTEAAGAQSPDDEAWALLLQIAAANEAGVAGRRKIHQLAKEARALLSSSLPATAHDHETLSAEVPATHANKDVDNARVLVKRSRRLGEVQDACQQEAQQEGYATVTDAKNHAEHAESQAFVCEHIEMERPAESVTPPLVAHAHNVFASSSGQEAEEEEQVMKREPDEQAPPTPQESAAVKLAEAQADPDIDMARNLEDVAAVISRSSRHTQHTQQPQQQTSDTADLGLHGTESKGDVSLEKQKLEEQEHQRRVQRHAKEVEGEELSAREEQVHVGESSATERSRRAVPKLAEARSDTKRKPKTDAVETMAVGCQHPFSNPQSQRSWHPSARCDTKEGGHARTVSRVIHPKAGSASSSAAGVAVVPSSSPAGAGTEGVRATPSRTRLRPASPPGSRHPARSRLSGAASAGPRAEPPTKGQYPPSRATSQRSAPAITARPCEQACSTLPAPPVGRSSVPVAGPMSPRQLAAEASLILSRYRGVLKAGARQGRGKAKDRSDEVPQSSASVADPAADASTTISQDASSVGVDRTPTFSGSSTPQNLEQLATDLSKCELAVVQRGAEPSAWEVSAATPTPRPGSGIPADCDADCDRDSVPGGQSAKSSEEARGSHVEELGVVKTVLIEGTRGGNAHTANRCDMQAIQSVDGDADQVIVDHGVCSAATVAAAAATSAHVARCESPCGQVLNTDTVAPTSPEEAVVEVAPLVEDASEIVEPSVHTDVRDTSKQEGSSHIDSPNGELITPASREDAAHTHNAEIPWTFLYFFGAGDDAPLYHITTGSA
mmetsp:Transcript_17287/g.46855  ORF Transcript_17287/g.46855 Transcript_17287/m.46855 type:complete len:798 (-) Transcript_17287:158-2551(-)